jgi:hypothetical protein
VLNSKGGTQQEMVFVIGEQLGNGGYMTGCSLVTVDGVSYAQMNSQ